MVPYGVSGLRVVFWALGWAGATAERRLTLGRQGSYLPDAYRWAGLGMTATATTEHSAKKVKADFRRRCRDMA